jgi:hypothetical protein
VQLLDGDIRSAQLFQRLGFDFEALLPAEICLDGARCSIQRWARHRNQGSAQPAEQRQA